MSFTIPLGSPKAVKAAAFGRELVKAARTRSVPLKELERATGVGHTSLDNYRRGLILPKVEVAKSLAAALDWPELGTMIVRFRTFPCARSGCGRTFRNDTGAPRKYCSEPCRRIAENVRIAASRARSHGQTKDARSKEHQIRRLRGGLAIADEQARMVAGAIGAMCAGCEPEGVCRTEDCPLRPFSPLPLVLHRSGEPRTEFEIRSATWTPSRREKHSTAMRARHAADPTIRTRQAARSAALHARRTPAEKAAWIRKISATKQAGKTRLAS